MLQVLCCFSKQLHYHRYSQNLYYRRNTNIYVAQLQQKVLKLFRRSTAALLCILTIPYSGQVCRVDCPIQTLYLQENKVLCKDAEVCANPQGRRKGPKQ